MGVREQRVGTGKEDYVPFSAYYGGEKRERGTDKVYRVAACAWSLGRVRID